MLAFISRLLTLPFASQVPAEIQRPDYVSHPEGISMLEEQHKDSHTIAVVEAQNIEILREVGKMAADVVAKAGKFVKAGLTCDQVDEFVHNLIISYSES